MQNCQAVMFEQIKRRGLTAPRMDKQINQSNDKIRNCFSRTKETIKGIV